MSKTHFMNKIETPSVFSFAWNLVSLLFTPITKPIAFALNFFRAKKEEQGMDETKVFSFHGRTKRMLARAKENDDELAQDKRIANQIVELLTRSNTEDDALKGEFDALRQKLSKCAKRQFKAFYSSSPSSCSGRVILPTKEQTCRYFQEYEDWFGPSPQSQGAGG